MLRALSARSRGSHLAYCGLRTSLYSTTAPIPPEISAWITTLTSNPPSISSEHLAPSRATQLHRTLPSRQDDPDSLSWPGLGHPPPNTGEPLPKAFHLAYFQPQSWLKDLGEDGSSTEYNAPAPYLRRMWAGGSFAWSPDVSLKVGDQVTESVSVPKAEFKAGMIFVHQQRLLYPGDDATATPAEDGWAVKEIRTHVFRKDVTRKEGLPPIPKVSDASESDPTFTFTFTPTAPLLFRYSALTWNAHRIHYDKTWCRDVEGHPDLVVHGPLSATMLVELAERIALDHSKKLVEFRYRATSPMYVDKPITLSASPGTLMDIWEMRVEQAGKKGMMATATLA